MISPYFQEDGITIYNADNRDILPHLPKFDLLLTDPPYGMDFRSSWKIEWQRHNRILGDNESFPLWLFDIPFNIAMFVFCRWNNLKDIPPPKSFIVWDKCRHGMGDLEHEFGRQWEGIAFYAGENHIFTRRPADIIRVPCIPPSQLIHPAEKPVSVWTTLLDCHPSGTVLDPFMGSGTTLVAAKLRGLHATGIELSKTYCDIAIARLSQKILIPI